jgi:hypothetical protein
MQHFKTDQQAFFSQALLTIRFKKLIGLLVLFGMIGCSTQSPQSQEKTAETAVIASAEQRDPAEMDGIFVAPGVDFSRYKKVIITELNLENIDIQMPPGWSAESPWILGETEKRFFRTEYTQAAVVNLIADGTYTTALNPADDVLLLRAKVTRLAPVLSQESPHDRFMAYEQKSGAMTLALELYDSDSGKLIGTIIDTRSLGRIWDDNSRASTSLQVRRAFAGWLKNLRIELDQLSRRRSTLDNLLTR